MQTQDGWDGHGSKSSVSAVGAERRDRILDVVRETPTPIALSDVARALVYRESPKLFTTEYDAQVSRIKIRLHHVVLPKLADRGEIDYDASRHLVR